MESLLLIQLKRLSYSKNRSLLSTDDLYRGIPQSRELMRLVW